MVKTGWVVLVCLIVALFPAGWRLPPAVPLQTGPSEDRSVGAPIVSPDPQPGADSTTPLTAPSGTPGPSSTPPAQSANLPAKYSSERPARNQETDNLNVLFLGADGDRLLTVAVYSINHQEDYRSGAVFFPVQTVLNGGATLARIFREQGPEALIPLIEAAMAVHIAYYVRVDQRILAEVEKLINPIVIDEQTVEVTDLFTMKISPQDDRILGALLAELTRPQVFFVHLPKLVLTFRRYLETDFAITSENLWLHYRIAKGVDTTAIPKVFAWGSVAILAGEPEPVLLIQPDWLGNIIFDLTRDHRPGG